MKLKNIILPSLLVAFSVNASATLLTVDELMSVDVNGYEYGEVVIPDKEYLGEKSDWLGHSFIKTPEYVDTVDYLNSVTGYTDLQKKLLVSLAKVVALSTQSTDDVELLGRISDKYRDVNFCNYLGLDDRKKYIMNTMYNKLITDDVDKSRFIESGKFMVTKSPYTMSEEDLMDLTMSCSDYVR